MRQRASIDKNTALRSAADGSSGCTFTSIGGSSAL
jgi:hypothetical protein